MQVIALFLIPIGALVFAIAIEALRERRLPEREVEAQEYSDWEWPERKVGPVARTHLGRRDFR